MRRYIAFYRGGSEWFDFLVNLKKMNMTLEKQFLTIGFSRDGLMWPKSASSMFDAFASHHVWLSQIVLVAGDMFLRSLYL